MWGLPDQGQVKGGSALQVDIVELISRKAIHLQLLCEAEEVIKAAILLHKHDDMLRHDMDWMGISECIDDKGAGMGHTPLNPTRLQVVSLMNSFQKSPHGQLTLIRPLSAASHDGTPEAATAGVRTHTSAHIATRRTHPIVMRVGLSRL